MVNIIRRDLSSKRVLVTGGAGFLGSHVVDQLLDLGYDVAVIDNLQTGIADNMSGKAKLYEADIANDNLEEIFKSVRPEIVIHLAAQISVQVSMQDPLLDARINVEGSLKIIDLCIRHGIAKLVFASSGGAIYGEPEYLPCDEVHPIRPLSNYGVSKFAVENYLFVQNLSHGLDYSILRFGNIYGPRQDPRGEAGVIAIFSRAMLEGRQITINGDGEQERDFVYVEDAANAVVKSISAKNGESYNVGMGKAHSINYIYSLLRDQIDYKLDAIYGPAKSGEVFRIYLDNTKAIRELDWYPDIPIEDGIERTVKWFKQ